MVATLESNAIKSGVCEQSLPLTSLEKLHCIMFCITVDLLAQEPSNKPKAAASWAGEMQKRNQPHHTEGSMSFFSEICGERFPHSLPSTCLERVLTPVRPKGQGNGAKWIQHQEL